MVKEKTEPNAAEQAAEEQAAVQKALDDGEAARVKAAKQAEEAEA